MYFIGKPAYGRKYKSKEEVLKDWYDGKDFSSAAGYFSIRDMKFIKRPVIIQYDLGKEVCI